MTGFSVDQIQAAATRIQDAVVRTPLLTSPQLDALAGCRVFLKAESLQRTGSFKYRGALNTMLSLTAEERGRGVITYSAGNHGQAVAAAARQMGCSATIIMPAVAPAVKVDNCRWWGAEVILYDPATQNRAEVMQTRMEATGAVFIAPFDDLRVMAGQGTIGLEMCRQVQDLGETFDAVLLNTSGGGLASGVTEAVKALSPQTACHIVEQAGYQKMAASLAAGVAQTIRPAPQSIMDGINGPSAGVQPLDVLLRHGVTPLAVSEDQVRYAMSVAFRTLKLVLEPAGAASLAAVLANPGLFAGQRVGLVASGGNVDPDVFIGALQAAG
ncbi:threonine ammonia-lyase [Novispirillum itersonii]|uniref:Threonine dehydratase n=1 Tax=Novispirillum itersonii TaxID=189 RepID=A0A7W9ZII5_NOVIT|nr:threonine/serine dehydratase [Novispirillum itersonii]MBB6212106.1 threonine dehydratase [Novispirillum itersonii]